MKAFDVLDNIKNIYMTDSMLELLTDFERVLDELDMYVYKNWEDGELVVGPINDRYFVTCSFMWTTKKMPDPTGAERLLDYDIKVDYKKDRFKFPRKVMKADDFRPGSKKPKIDEIPVWIVEIKIPKKLMTDIKQGYVEMQGEQIDYEDIDDGMEMDLDKAGISDTFQDDEEMAFQDEESVI